MGYMGGVAPESRDRAVSWIVGEPSKIVRRGVAVVGTLAALSVTLYRTGRKVRP